MDRRAFIRSGCLQCAGLIGLSALASSLEGCSTLPIVKATAANGKLRVPITSFKEGRVMIVRDARLPDDLLVVKNEDGTFTALLLKCTHRDQPLSATTTEIHCTAHGSRFALDGRVLEGPASRPLKKYSAALEQGDVLIQDLP